ncbi:MAG: TonB family protein [Cytophagaceae bacterium]|jgi:TonB family protein|nr:TonB family protein [Cytophagaceae bacterium]
MEEQRKKERVTGIVWSVVFHAALLVLFFFLAIKTTPSEEEGILVNFGDSPTGRGVSEPVRNEPTAERTTLPAATTSPPPSSPPQPSQTTPVQKPVMTQNYEETARINAEKQKKREAEQKKQREEREKREEQERQQRIEETKRKQAEEAERKRIAEEQRIQEEKNKKAQQARNTTKDAFSRTQGTSASEGETQGSGNQGYLTGDPNATNRQGTGLGNAGNSFSLSGRNISGSLPKPVDNCNEQGVVVIDITVDKTGKVTDATYSQRGTTNNSPCLIKAAEAAAKKAKFNNDPNAAAYQKGTITYSFEYAK